LDCRHILPKSLAIRREASQAPERRRSLIASEPPIYPVARSAGSGDQDARRRIAGSTGERAVATVLIVAQLFVRIACAFHHAIDSDEPQHLHVAWGWAHGLLPYRDFFDNHAPLFSACASPLIRIFGERPDIVQLARLMVLPLTVIAMASTWLIARRLFSSRVALWAVVLAGFWPDFLLTSVEYRTDVLWMATWLSAVAVLIGGTFGRRRLVAGGFLLGVALCVSLKTLLLLLALGVAVSASAWMRSRIDRQLCLRGMQGTIVVCFAALAFAPAVVAIYFAASRAWGPLVYCLVRHNLVPGLGLWRHLPRRLAILPVTLPLLWWIAHHVMAEAPDAATGTRRAIVFLSVGVYIAALEATWPLITKQDYLPFYPLAAVLATPLLLGFPGWVARRQVRFARVATAPWSAVLLTVTIEVTALCIDEPPWLDHSWDETRLLSTTLMLTRPDEFVMDIKGETVFRSRPYFFALEGVTKDRISRGLMRDDIATRLVSTGTPVVAEDSYDFPGRARAFMDSNYVSVGDLRVVGMRLDPTDVARSSRRFVIRVPQRYAVVTEGGIASGLLDGTGCRRPRELSAGAHAYRFSPGEGRVAVIWASAVERGFSPFAHGKVSR